MRAIPAGNEPASKLSDTTSSLHKTRATHSASKDKPRVNSAQVPHSRLTRLESPDGSAPLRKLLFAWNTLHKTHQNRIQIMPRSRCGCQHHGLSRTEQQSRTSAASSTLFRWESFHSVGCRYKGSTYVVHSKRGESWSLFGQWLNRHPIETHVMWDCCPSVAGSEPEKLLEFNIKCLQISNCDST